MKKCVIYTCCVGQYDRLLQPACIDDAFDYVCFSNDMATGEQGVWQIRPLPFTGSNATVTSRYPKLMPHRVLPEYEYSVYIDANIQIVHPDFYAVVKKQMAEGILIAQVPHSVPPIDCIYDEISYAFRYCKVSLKDALRQARYLRRHGFPRHYGLFENNLIFRCHNNLLVTAVSEQWWQEFTCRAPRDQFSLMYVYWQQQYMPVAMLPHGQCTRNSPWLHYHPHTFETVTHRQVTMRERLTVRFHRWAYPLLRCCLAGRPL